jgi:predicted nucleotidyltransferase
MENRAINISVLAEVAKALKELKDEMVFVGGAVVSFYADDTANDEIRPTVDIDMAIKLLNFKNWFNVNERLAELGFYPDPFGNSICSYKYKNIPIDIMSAVDSPLGASNRWYKIGFKSLQTIEVENVTIQILSAPCYLATKFEAFNDRGTDYRTSHDFEDIIYVLDNCINIVEEVTKAQTQIKDFLQEEIRKVLDNPNFEEIISVHLHPVVMAERQDIILDKMKKILNH